VELIADELRKVPPQQLEAEQSLLGGILLDNAGLPSAMETLTGDEFYRDAHRIIFRVIQELFERNEPVDLVTVVSLLSEKNKLEAVGGATYLASLVESVPSATNVPAYAKIVNEKALLRRLIQAAPRPPTFPPTPRSSMKRHCCAVSFRLPMKSIPGAMEAARMLKRFWTMRNRSSLPSRKTAFAAATLPSRTSSRRASNP